MELNHIPSPEVSTISHKTRKAIMTGTKASAGKVMVALLRLEADLAQANQGRGHRLVGYIPDLLYDPALSYLDEIHPGLAATLRSSGPSERRAAVRSGTDTASS